MSKLYEVSEDTIDKFLKLWKTKASPVEISFTFVGDEKLKTLIKISRISDHLAFAMKSDILVKINDELASLMDDESIQILFEQEMDKIIADGNTGKIKISNPSFSTFPGIIEKHGIEKVLRANQLDNISVEQVADSDPFSF